MATCFSSEKIKYGIQFEENETPDENTVTINEQKYIMVAYLYKKGEPKENGFKMDRTTIVNIKINDSLKSIFQTVSLTYTSNFGMNYERSTDYAYKNSEESKIENYIFEGNGKDRVYIFFCKKYVDGPYSPYPVLDGDFVVVDRLESMLNNQENRPNQTQTKLILVPDAQWNLMTSYPQWTTGFDKEYKVNANKRVDQCIKELLLKCNEKIDEERFEKINTNINLTSLSNRSCLDTIKYLLQFNSPDSTSFLRYNQYSKKFVLVDMKSLVQYDQLNDDIGTFPVGVIKDPMAHSSTASIVIGIPPGGISRAIVKFPSANNMITELQSKLMINYHNGTFKISPFEYNLDRTEDIFKEKYTKDPATGGLLDPNSPIEVYDEDVTKNIIKTSYLPNYRPSENHGYSNMILSRIMNTVSINYTVAGQGLVRHPGRKIMLTNSNGSIDNFTKTILGTYMITGLTTTISPDISDYQCAVTAVKLFKNKERTFDVSTINTIT